MQEVRGSCLFSSTTPSRARCARGVPAALTGDRGLAAKLQVSRPMRDRAPGPSQGGSAGSNPVGATQPTPGRTAPSGWWRPFGSRNTGTMWSRLCTRISATSASIRVLRTGSGPCRTAARTRSSSSATSCGLGVGWGSVSSRSRSSSWRVLSSTSLVVSASPALLLAEGAGFKGVQVAVDCGFGLGDLAAHRAQLLLVLLAQGRGLAAGGADGAFEQVGLLVGGHQRLEHGLVELVGGQPVGGARRPAVAVAGVAGVVAVALAAA